MKRTTKRKSLKRTTKRTKKPKTIRGKVIERAYTREELEGLLSAKWIKFAHLYILEYNGTQSVMTSFGKEDTKKNRKHAAIRAVGILANVKVQQYIAHIERDIAREVGISKIGLLKRLKYIAEADLTDIFDDWLTRKELMSLKKAWPGLTKAIKKTESKVVHKTDPMTGEPFHEEYLKIELHDPLRATEMIFKALGWNEAEQVNIKQETKVSVDISKYDDSEKALLLKMARKNEYKAE